MDGSGNGSEYVGGSATCFFSVLNLSTSAPSAVSQIGGTVKSPAACSSFMCAIYSTASAESNARTHLCVSVCMERNDSV